MMRSSVSVVAFCILACVASAAAPIISGVTSSPVNDTWAQIGWQTDAAANSEIDYGPTTSYGSTVSNGALVTAHKLQLDNLTSATLYHYRVRSTNGSAEMSVSGDYTFTTTPAVYGCESNPTGNPIGGGLGYSRIYTPAEATVVVSTKTELLIALSSATSGNVIYIDDNAQIDLTGSTNIVIPGGVTLASGRGRNGSTGGLIFTNQFAGTTILFKTGGAGVRVTGLRMQGPFNGIGRTIPYSHGIQFLHNGGEVDNCEILGFNYSGVTTTSNLTSLHVHHCYIHHTTRNGLGYGVAPSRSWALIEGNIFDYCRHCIASSGQSPSGYEARYNLHMEHSISHLFDMHGANDFEKYVLEGNWRFDESSGAAADDTSIYGYNDATLQNFSAPGCWVGGKINNGLQFDGVDDYVDAGTQSNLAGSNFSVTAWIKPSTVSGTHAIASKGDNASSGYGYALRLAGSTLEGTVHNSSGAIATGATASGTISAGVWTHVAMTFNGATATLYINGASAKTFSCSGVLQNSNYKFLIGRDSTGASSFYGGLLDEVRCYSNCISAADVVRHYNLQGDIAGDVIRIHHNTTRSMMTSVLVRGIPTVGCWVNNNWFWRNFDDRVAFQTNATGNFYEFNNIYGVQGAPPPDPAEGTMLGEWRFNEGSGTTTADSSGYGRTGTLTNMNTTTAWVAGKSGTAIAFDGVNDYVSCGASLTQTDNIALDFWVKFDQFAEYDTILTNNTFDVYNRSGWAGNKLYFRYHTTQYDAGGDSAWAYYTGVKSNTELTTGTWYHVTCTRSGDRMRIYINGALERELDCLAGFTIVSPSTLKFSHESAGFKGALDEIKIFTPGPESPGRRAPTLTWTGEANFGSDGLNPQSGTIADQYTFKVKYADADGDPPMLGYPRLRIFREGTEFTYMTPLSMLAVDSSGFATGRNYVCTVKLPRGSDYTYSFEAIDETGVAATGAATVATAGPSVTTGNTAPVLQWPDETNYIETGAYPLTGTSDTIFDYRIEYVDIDNDAPQAGYPKARIMRGGVDIPGSPFTMAAVDSASYLVGRKYQLLKKLTAATDYTYSFIAKDSNGVSADPAVAVNAPDVTAGTEVWTELYTTATNPTAGTIPVQVVFSQSVTGFAQGDVTVANGTISGFTGSGASYSFTVTPTASGAVTVNVAAGVCTNGSGTSNLAATQLSRMYYPASGADEIWIGHGYPGARLGTMTDPFDWVSDGIQWLKSGGTMHFLSGMNPETIRIAKPMRILSYGGTATVGRN